MSKNEQWVLLPVATEFLSSWIYNTDLPDYKKISIIATSAATPQEQIPVVMLDTTCYDDEKQQYANAHIGWIDLTNPTLDISRRARQWQDAHDGVIILAIEMSETFTGSTVEMLTMRNVNETLMAERVIIPADKSADSWV